MTPRQEVAEAIRAAARLLNDGDAGEYDAAMQPVYDALRDHGIGFASIATELVSSLLGELREVAR